MKPTSQGSSVLSIHPKVKLPILPLPGSAPHHPPPWHHLPTPALWFSQSTRWPGIFGLIGIPKACTQQIVGSWSLTLTFLITTFLLPFSKLIWVLSKGHVQPPGELSSTGTPPGLKGAVQPAFSKPHCVTSEKTKIHRCAVTCPGSHRSLTARAS